MPQLEHIDAIERHLWEAADTLRANSQYASNEYFLPVMGLVFLRHAYSRYLAVRDEIAAGLPTTRSGRKRALTKEDFSQRSAIFLQPAARFDHLVALRDGEDCAAAVIAAMESIERDYESLRGVLPKAEYQALSNDVLGQLLRTLNPDELEQVSGDVFGRIYEYFLTQFADQKAHDGGELRRADYFWRQARWLTERFPDGELRDVAGLVKLVDRAEIEANDWSLTPGRYVGVAPEEEDADFDFATAMREIHAELADLDAEATVLAAKIRKNFEKLGV